MSTPKTTGSGCTDCSSRVSELQDQVEALSRELAESKERQNGMGKEIDALKELFEGMRSAVFTAPSTGPVKLVASSPQDTSGDIPTSHTPPIAPLPASLPTPVLGDIPAPTTEPFSRPISPPQELLQSQHTDIEVSTKIAAPAEVKAPTEFEAPTVLEAPVEIEAPTEIEAPVEIEGSVDIVVPGQMQVDSEHLIYTFIFFILMDCVVAGHGGSHDMARADLPMRVSPLPSIIISPAEINSVAAALGLAGFIPVEPTPPPPVDDSIPTCKVPIINPAPMDTQEGERADMDIQDSGSMDTS